MKSRPSQIGRFVTKHSRLLVYLGALIVFFTFVVKEGLREHLKDAAGSISAANDIFTIREDNMETRLELRQLKEDLINRDAVTRSWSDIRVVQTKCQQMYYSLAAVAYLIETINDEEEFPKTAALQQELTKIQFGSLDLNISQSTVNTLSLSAFALESRVAQFEDEVMQRARLRLEQKRRLYGASAWASYVLYTFGWGLGLLGKLYGVPDAAGEA